RLLEYIRYGIHERRNDVAQALQGLMPYETARPEVRWLDKFNEKEPLRMVTSLLDSLRRLIKAMGTVQIQRQFLD
ncbi:MAG: hypothetical protein V1908_04835, partial [Candidatus Peregrinibacteria bacterium]